MPSTYKTPNFALNQWLGTDSFARADFNADNLAIDAALKRLSDDVKAIDPLATNLYNLILQQYYDGKYTGYKKALIFDGFMNYSNSASLSQGIYIESAGTHRFLTFDNVGYSSFSTGNPDQNVNASATRTWTPEYCTLASAITVFCYTSDANATVTVTITDENGAVVGVGSKSGELPVGSSYQSYVTIPFSSPVSFTAKMTYTIAVTCTTNINLRRTANIGQMYFSLTCSPILRNTGSCMSKAADIGNDYTRAIGWVRYAGGSVGLGLDVGGSSLEFSLTGAYPAYTADGTLACTEASFELDVPAGLSGDTAVRLTLDKNGEENMRVYDYGVLFI